VSVKGAMQRSRITNIHRAQKRIKDKVGDKITNRNMKNITKQYQDLLEGKMSQHNFMTNVRREFPNWVSSTNSYKDAISILKAKRVITEAVVNPSAEDPNLRGYDHVSYPELMKGMKFELAKAEVVSDESMVKAKETALKNLQKDPNFYRELFVANYKEVKEMDEDLKMKEVKENNKVDKPNELKVVKKDAAANTEDTLSKKEAKKKKDGEGIEQMKGSTKKISGVKATVATLKEHILNEMSILNPRFENFAVGNRVKKKDGSVAGEITDWDGDTATVKADDGQIHHIQGNILTKGDVQNVNPRGMRLGGGLGQDSSYNSKKESKHSSKIKEIRNKLAKAMSKELGENLYKNKKTGIIQSFDPVRDQEEMKDPQFNQIFTKA
jgi:hypothetical protein